MFGKGIYPVTEWDEALDAAMPRPGFQPLEYLIGGGYLGEIGRRLVVDAARKNGLFQELPEIWLKPYSLPTELLANLEYVVTTPSLENPWPQTSLTYQFRVWPEHKLPASYSEIDNNLPDLTITAEDARALILISQHISSRAANYCAIALHAMIKLRERAAISPSADPSRNVVPIAFVGSVMEKYPRLLERTQASLDRLTGWSSATESKQRMLLEFSSESAIFGAAVAVAAALEKSNAPGSSGSLTAPVSLPHTERSSNASTLLHPAHASEGEDKSVSRSEESAATKKTTGEFSYQDPIHDDDDDKNDAEAAQRKARRPSFWSRFTNFFKNILYKVFKK
ncbi:Hexokinase-1 [Dactylella cylindrospora]|nr:Hexokinase-1 [Dactylella cylindrospora]